VVRADRSRLEDKIEKDEELRRRDDAARRNDRHPAAENRVDAVAKRLATRGYTAHIAGSGRSRRSAGRSRPRPSSCSRSATRSPSSRPAKAKKDEAQAAALMRSFGPSSGRSSAWADQRGRLRLRPSLPSPGRPAWRARCAGLQLLGRGLDCPALLLERPEAAMSSV